MPILLSESVSLKMIDKLISGEHMSPYKEEKTVSSIGNPYAAALTVSQLAKKIKYTIEDYIGFSILVGESSGVTYSQPGHIYMTLKDATAQMKVVIFKRDAQRLPFTIENGKQFYVSGHVTFFDRYGSLQINATKVEPQGEGALQLAFEQMKAKLDREGLFQADRKKPLPFIPSKIVIVTSPTGAAIQDILHVIHTRFPPVHISVYPVKVQGQGSAQQIAHAIRDINQQFQDCDVMIVGRGGGSMEDLWAFNEEPVARAIAASRIPIISAVGHETDVTISDMVADIRALTPTAAAQMVVPDFTELLKALQLSATRMNQSIQHFIHHYEGLLQRYQSSHGLRAPFTLFEHYHNQIQMFGSRLRMSLGERQETAKQRINVLSKHLDIALNERLHNARTQLSAAKERLSLRPVQAQISFSEKHLHQLRNRLQISMNNRFTTAEESLRSSSQLLESYSPLKVLTRGYSVTRNKNKQVVRHIKEIKEKDKIVTQVQDGQIYSTVTEIIKQQD